MTEDIDLGVFQTGDSIRLKATFRSFAEVLTDLTAAPTLKIYDGEQALLTTIAGASLTRASLGVYYYDYIIPLTGGTYFIEFAGFEGGTPILRRGYFFAGFV